MRDTVVKDTMLVDGYNVIHAWPELIELSKDNLEHARDKLGEILTGYGAFKSYAVMLVFDAQGVAGQESCREENEHLMTVYTKEGETADSYIEKTAYLLARQDRSANVYVVTSDWMEQRIILGAGAFRISARELYLDVKKTGQILKETFSEGVLNRGRHELGSRISGEVAKRLDEIRRS
ncbi:MAG: NYN domain-containing protein [Pelosinus sp.]|nr:NYN domain-containing protein [Pelosinus sp.]